MIAHVHSCHIYVVVEDGALTARKRIAVAFAPVQIPVATSCSRTSQI